MSFRFRHAICNEVFEGWDFAASCRAIKAAGYEGIEIAPFTLNEYPATITQDERREYRRIMAGEGLAFVGLHWLMVSPKGLHVTTPDESLRAKSWQHIHDLIDLCADLAEHQSDKGILVFGSPKQRGTTGGLSRPKAFEHYEAGIRSVAEHAASRRVTVLPEALPFAECDVMNTVEEAAGIVARANSPGVRTMFDTHNAADEKAPHAEVVDRFFDVIRHVHVNEMDGRCPGTGSYDFGSIFGVLKRRNYQGWISLEVFDFKPDAVTIATNSLRYLEMVIETQVQ
jgi:sugar phosphate isomerase/epimerase